MNAKLEDVAVRVRDVVSNVMAGVGPDAMGDGVRLAEDLGADSLDAVELVMELEEEFDVSITDVESKEIKTVGDLIRLIDTKTI